MIKRLLFTALLAMLPLGVVYATPITMNFTADGFTPVISSIGAPQDPVSGQFVWDAASVNSNINSLTSVSLTIDGHTYLLAELGFDNPSLNFYRIGGILTGVGALVTSTNDFAIGWRSDTLSPGQFMYSSANTNADAWQTFTFTQFSVTAGSIPEPATLALLGLGLAGLGFSRRKRAS